MDKMEQMLIHFYFDTIFFEIYRLKSFKFKFLNQIIIQIIGLSVFYIQQGSRGAIMQINSQYLS